MSEAEGMDTRSGTTGPMPVVFVGHGSPMNAVEDNTWSRAFVDLGRSLPRPAAILSVSAHWYVDGTFLTADARPGTIHDFGGFPRALREVQYPAPGQVDLARQVQALLAERGAALSTQWGLDHGTWSVLKWMFPAADVPVVQLSIDRRLAPRQHLELARSLQDLRHQGVLVMGSGNVVHNLSDAFGRMRTGATDTPDWARRFDRTVAEALLAGDVAALVDLRERDRDGELAHPTADHWLPLIYALGAGTRDSRVRFAGEGFDLGSLSMRNVVWG